MNSLFLNLKLSPHVIFINKMAASLLEAAQMFCAITFS